MELKGQVILDKESMDALEEKIREEIINDIKENGNYSSEIEKYMNDCNFESYMRMIKCTIDNVISKIDKEDISFDSGWKAYHQILAIKTILDI